MLVLHETAAGYALFKVLDESNLKDSNEIYKHFESPEKANKSLKLKSFLKFENTIEALEAVTALVEDVTLESALNLSVCSLKDSGLLGCFSYSRSCRTLSKNLKSFLSKEIVKKDLNENLIVSDPKLGQSISKKLGIKIVSDESVSEIFRGIRSQFESLVQGLKEADLNSMVLGLSHSLSRYKLKFSPDKVDNMIIQAIALLDELDKEINTYAMRVKEWYGWHFPEVVKIIVDNMAFAKTIKLMGFRTNAATTDLSSILPEEIETAVKQAAEISMGTEISDEDIENISYLCDQIISITEYRSQLFDYLKNRMAAIAPNLTSLVGELVGARLISHAGSLMNLSKQPASTIQILGAEKALFRALKSKHDTPKYGLLYHASLVGQAGPKIKGKIARTVATKAALAIRCDALGETEGGDYGVELRTKIESRLRQLEGKTVRTAQSSAAKPKTKQEKAEYSVAPSYNASSDAVVQPKSATKRKAEESPAHETEGSSHKKKDKKSKKEETAETSQTPSKEPAKKKKKEKKNKE